MSRAVLVNAPKPDVAATCAQRKITVSAIESLLSGGTRVVLTNMADADAIRLAYKKHLIQQPVIRMKWADKS